MQAPWLSAELLLLWCRLTLCPPHWDVQGAAAAGGSRKGVGGVGFDAWGDSMSSFTTALWGFPIPQLGAGCKRICPHLEEPVQPGTPCRWATG